METEIDWPCLKVFWLSKDNYAGHSERRRGGRTILKSGQGWTLLGQQGQLRTGLGGKGLLSSHLWCPNDLARLWNSI
ncbi:MAG: hypothetical protein AB2693_01745, partial [Candidatus Thiodiazotropha sp.]